MGVERRRREAHAVEAAPGPGCSATEPRPWLLDLGSLTSSTSTAVHRPGCPVILERVKQVPYQHFLKLALWLLCLTLFGLVCGAASAAAVSPTWSASSRGMTGHRAPGSLVSHLGPSWTMALASYLCGGVW